MEWTNNIILEFLNSYEKYPVIWDPKDMGHKNRNEVREAWNCIREDMSIDFPVETLKRKKESLMATYRYLRRKVIESARLGNGHVHRPSWFAFETMDRFLNTAVKSMSSNTQDEVMIDDTDEHILNEEDIDELELREHFVSDDQTTEITKPDHHELAVTKPIQNIPRPLKRRRFPQGGLAPKFGVAKSMKRASDAFKSVRHQPSQQGPSDECALYGQLLATKLRAMDKRTRTIVTNKIDNLVFKAEMQSIDPLPTTAYESFSEDSHQLSPLPDNYSETSVEVDVKLEHLHNTTHSSL